jgi:CPA2 family monovalent cation:H+ antiporter-2
MTVILMLTLIPVLGGEEDDLLADLVVAFAKAIALVAGIWIAGSFVLPRVLGRIAVSRSRELFLLTVVALALGTATLSHEAGLSFAFGAFLAGLLLSESEYAHRTLVEVLPLREVFAVVFFVAIGMLMDPDAFEHDLDLVLLITAIGVFGKTALIAGIAVLFRFPVRTALAAGVALGSVGEFSFVIATQAIDEEIISQHVNEAIIAAVLLSMALAPLLFMVHEQLLAYARETPILGAVLRPRTEEFLPEEPRLVNHAIIVGYTQAGREVATALAAREFRYLVIDDDPAVFRELSAAGVPCILGNASLPIILERASIGRARVLVITVTDPGYIVSTAATARQLNRRLDIVARGVTEDAPAWLREIGVARVVEAEFEVGQQFVRHTLQHFGLTSQEVQAFLAARRRDRMG